MTTENYFANEDAGTLAHQMDGVRHAWDKWGTNPIVQSWVRNTIAYYSAVLEPNGWNTSLVFDGEQGELIKMAVPQARSLVRQFVSLLTKQRLAFQCIAQSNQADVVNENRLGNALVNQIIDKERLDQKAERMAEMSCVLGISFLKTTWRSDKGEPFASSDNSGIIYEGDLEISVLGPFECYFDYNIEEWEALQWAEARTLKNRWDLIAQFPDMEEAIRQLPKAKDARQPYHTGYAQTIVDNDMVFCYEFYHKPTPALPQGRMVMYANPQTIFYDGINKYGCIPIEPCKPEPVMGFGFGYPMLSNLLPSQEMLDHSFSAIATNQSAFAVQNVTVPRGSGISVQQINGMNFIQYTPQNAQGGGKPEPLQLTQSSPETFKFIDVLRSHMLEISNINSALRGSPPPGVTSGAAIATLTTNAFEFITSFSKAYSLCLERTMLHAINAYRKFAEVPKIVRMVGKNYQAYSKEFIGTDLDPIQDIKITIANPMMQTVAGRSDLAEKLLQMGVVKDVQAYISILNGDDPSVLYKTELSENDLILSENDALTDGQQVVALSTDDHARHIREHACLLNNPQIRFNNNMVQGILAHMLEHEQLAKETDPFLMAMVRTGKMPQAEPMPGMGPGLPPPGEVAPQQQEQEQKREAPKGPEFGQQEPGAARRAKPAVDGLEREPEEIGI